MDEQSLLQQFLSQEQGRENREQECHEYNDASTFQAELEKKWEAVSATNNFKL